jgi:negative regulator of flagellin synthesis FlgM
MNPIDNNINVRAPRSETDQVGRRAGNVESATGPESAAGGSAAAESSAAGESVSFTNTAAELLSLENQLRELPGIDQARVDSIRQAIASGNYEIDAERIVDSLIRSDNDFGLAQPPGRS